MKPLNSATALLMAAALVAGVTGCKHAPPKPPTPIPGRAVSDVPPVDNTGGPVRPTNPGNLGNQGPRSNPVDQTPTGGKLGDGQNTGANGLNNPSGATPTDTTSKPLTDEQKNTQVRPEGPQDEDRSMFAADTVYFDFDRSTVKPSELPKLQRVAAYLKSNSGVTLRVEGNCDERGTEEYNRSLGERRALAVRELLIAEGVDPTRVTTLSYGEDKPADTGHDEAAWAKNRRGDFVVLKAKSLQ